MESKIEPTNVILTHVASGLQPDLVSVPRGQRLGYYINSLLFQDPQMKSFLSQEGLKISTV